MLLLIIMMCSFKNFIIWTLIFFFFFFSSFCVGIFIDTMSNLYVSLGNADSFQNSELFTQEHPIFLAYHLCWIAYIPIMLSFIV